MSSVAHQFSNRYLIRSELLICCVNNDDKKRRILIEIPFVKRNIYLFIKRKWQPRIKIKQITIIHLPSLKAGNNVTHDWGDGPKFWIILQVKCFFIQRCFIWRGTWTTLQKTESVSLTHSLDALSEVVLKILSLALRLNFDLCLSLSLRTNSKT